jgi:glycolate oxidase FAD binding subunit
MRTLGESGTALRPRGGGTKFGWGEPTEVGAIVSTEVMSGMTAVLGAGTPLAFAQREFASSGQMLALDPPLGDAEAATIGGIVASNDSGPLRHRYRSARDLVLGMTIALSDGTLSRSGSRVIKNVAGYDLAKLLTGSFGTLGLIVELIVRLHPLSPRTVTVVGASDDASVLREAVLALSHASLEIEALDVSWQGGHGGALASFGGVAPEAQADVAHELMENAGLGVTRHDDDDVLWKGQRDAQRAGPDEISVKVSALPGDLAHLIGVTERERGSLVGRAGLGLFWVRLPSGNDVPGTVARVRAELGRKSLHCVLLDGAGELHAEVWGDVDAGTLGVMRAVKSRFDPAGVCAPGLFVGGI